MTHMRNVSMTLFHVLPANQDWSSQTSLPNKNTRLSASGVRSERSKQSQQYALASRAESKDVAAV